MMQVAEFAYTQVRLQARHGARADTATWKRLAGAGDLLHFLQSARTTPLRPWVLHFSAHTDIHAMQASLRQEFRQYITQVASWQPRRWREAVLWTRRLLDLPALQHLLLGEPPPLWMLADPALKGFATADPRRRVEALQDSDCGVLLQAWQQRRPLLDGWIQRWRNLWPGAPAAVTAPLEQLAVQLQGYLEDMRREDTDAGSQRTREVLAAKLGYEFRRHSHQPAAAFLHLALVGLDLQRLRGALVRRALFAKLQGAHP